MKVFQRHVECELEKARRDHPPINSLHEGYAVILEELQEFWGCVMARQPDAAVTYGELIQVAAMAQRVAEDVIDTDRKE